MKKVKLPQGMRYYIYNGVEDLTRVEIRFMLNGKNKSKLINPSTLTDSFKYMYFCLWWL